MGKWPGSMEGLVMSLPLVPDASFWRDKRVLLTGHTGFKGAWLLIWLHRLGANVRGLSLQPESHPNLFDLGDLSKLGEHTVADLQDAALVQQTVNSFQPEIVFHLGAQALVRRSYAEPLKTFNTNIMGTAHVLQALTICDPIEAIVLITTDKVYRNSEDGRAFKESDPLGGHDPYSGSKAACEIVAESYYKSFFALKQIGLITARAGNVIGGGDWSENRLIPDAIRAWQLQQPLHIRYPEAVRPWQHVVEPLCAYLCAAQALVIDDSLSGPYNFGPPADSAIPVGELVQRAAQLYGGSAAVTIEPPEAHLHEAQQLRLDVARASLRLGVEPTWGIDTSLEKTIAWYQLVQDNKLRAYDACVADIDAFTSARLAL
jgi:CDP-glucose 4,6-dehydratase